jgi:hypothetical protein
MITQEYAVLTGDLVKSSRLTVDESNQTMAWLREYSLEFACDHPGAVVGRISTFRHDSWQLLLSQPQLALTAAVFLRAALKMHSDAKTKYDSRISIGTGSAEFINKEDVSDSRGDAFTISGKGLDGIGKQRLALHISESSELSSLNNLTISLLDCVVSDWTSKEARAIYGAIKGWTQDKSAEMWPNNNKTGKPPTRQTVHKSLSRAHWETVESVLSNYECQTR